MIGIVWTPRTGYMIFQQMELFRVAVGKDCRSCGRRHWRP